LRKYLSSIRWLILIAVIIVGLDQATKAIIRTNLAFGEMWAPWSSIIPFARIIHITNTGVAFGLFKGANLIFMVLAMIVSAGIIYYYPSVPKQDWLVRLALSLQLAGAAGNLIDRIFFGKVTDFVSIGNFPVFNVADSSITIGVILLLIGVWFQEKKLKQITAKPDESVNTPGSES
jgi:signal peptidase II